MQENHSPVESVLHPLFEGDWDTARLRLEEAEQMDRWCQDQMAAVGGG